MELTESTVYCPYCGEPISVLLDPSEAGDEYTEDCQVCCRPIIMAVVSDGAQLTVAARAEHE